MNNRFYYLIVLVGCMILNFSCSKEEEGTPLPPTITLEQESPIYQVKVGGTLTPGLRIPVKFLYVMFPVNAVIVTFYESVRLVSLFRGKKLPACTGRAENEIQPV